LYAQILNKLPLIFITKGVAVVVTVANQKQELPLAAIFVGGTERNGETL
jgi:hypothetical protein